jgi:hypothetical protein
MRSLPFPVSVLRITSPVRSVFCERILSGGMIWRTFSICGIPKVDVVNVYKIS